MLHDPTGLPLWRGKQLSSIRTTSLKPPGVSTHQIVNFFVPNIIKGTIDLCGGTDSEGNSDRNFLHVRGFLRDYPASLQAITVSKRSAGGPCTHCIFVIKITMTFQINHTQLMYVQVTNVSYEIWTDH